jgi:glycosyltransferase involved in cell wall biosynthesis
MVGKDVDGNNKLFSSFIKEYSLSGRIFLLGERDDVPAIYAGLDIVTSASHGEGFPNVVGEAMSAGIPCVVTDAGDSAKIVGETGFVVPVNDPIALSYAWRKLIEMGEGRRRKLGEAARKRIEDNYSIKKITKDFEDIYMEVVNGKCMEEQDYI